MYPKQYCVTRWTGIGKSTDALIKAWGYLQRLKQNLIRDGYGPKIYEEEVIDDEYTALFSTNELINLDMTERGNISASAKKCDLLLNESYGITDANWGLNACICTLMKHYNESVLLMQTIKTPIQHRLARIIRKLIRKMSLMKDDVYIPPYSIWRDTMSDPCVDKKSLVSAIDSIGKSFCSTLIDSLQKRLEPYMPFFEAMELIDPTAPMQIGIKDATWEAVRDICNRNGIDYSLVRTQIITMRGDACDYSDRDMIHAKENLLKYYHDRYKNESTLQELNDYARIIFVLPFETVLIESMFSVMNYNKDRKRVRLSDEAVEGIIHSQAITPVLNNIDNGLSSEMSLDLSCFDYKLKF